MSETLTLTDAGFYCAAGDFYIDPWLPVPRALITHAHGDHAHPENLAYLAAADGASLLRARIGPDATIDTIRYGEVRRLGAVEVSFHPAGHVLGSAQIRIAHKGRVTVVSGDYKLAPDPTCAPFEPVRCDTFLTESTFGLPIYRWDDTATVLKAIVAWWERNRGEKKASVLFAYALGKAQPILAGLVDVASPLRRPVFCHGAVARINAVYRDAGIALPATVAVAHGRARRVGDAWLSRRAGALVERARSDGARHRNTLRR